MAGLELSHVDLEYSGHSHRSSVSVNISDADKGSCYSQFYSTADACANEFNNSVDIENGDGESKVKIERDCRICHLSLLSESEVVIELGCSCKDDLAAAHKHCAETWFTIKGNKTCEICNSIAYNVVGPNDIESAQQTNEVNALATNAAPAQVSVSSESRTCSMAIDF